MEAIPTRNITLALDLICLFIHINKYLCIYLYIEIYSPDINLIDGFMIYSTTKKEYLFIISIYPSKQESYHKLIYQVIEQG
jgi:hypothetical protein